MARLRWFNYLLLAALLAFSIAAWPTLPHRIPTHFGPGGEPDAWSAKGASWFLLPAIGTFTFLVMMVSIRMVLRRPDMINIPSKQQFLSLPREDQQPILEFTANTLHALSTILLCIFLIIQYATWRAAFGHSTRTLMMGVLLLSLVGIPAFALVLLTRTSRMIGQAYQRARARGVVP